MGEKFQVVGDASALKAAVARTPVTWKDSMEKILGQTFDVVKPDDFYTNSGLCALNATDGSKMYFPVSARAGVCVCVCLLEQCYC